MKYLDISYSRLFSLGLQYGNESFDLHVKLGVGDKADQVMGKLFIKVAQMEAVFEKYRQTLRTINGLIDSVNFEINRIGRIQADIDECQSKLKEMSGQTYEELEGPIAKLRAAYPDYNDLAVKLKISPSMIHVFEEIGDMIERRKDRQNTVENLHMRLEALRNTRKILLDGIKEGNFNVEV